MFCFVDVRLEQKAVFYAIFLKRRFWRADKKLIWTWDKVRLLLQYLQTFNILSIISWSPQIRLLILANKKTSPTPFPENLPWSVVEAVICRRSSRLYGVSLLNGLFPVLMKKNNLIYYAAALWLVFSSTARSTKSYSIVVTSVIHAPVPVTLR